MRAFIAYSRLTRPRAAGFGKWFRGALPPWSEQIARAQKTCATPRRRQGEFGSDYYWGSNAVTSHDHHHRDRRQGDRNYFDSSGQGGAPTAKIRAGVTSWARVTSPAFGADSAKRIFSALTAARLTVAPRHWTRSENSTRGAHSRLRQVLADTNTDWTVSSRDYTTRPRLRPALAKDALIRLNSNGSALTGRRVGAGHKQRARAVSRRPLSSSAASEGGSRLAERSSRYTPIGRYGYQVIARSPLEEDPMAITRAARAEESRCRSLFATEGGRSRGASFTRDARKTRWRASWRSIA